MIRYQNHRINYGQGLLQLNQSRLPFDISLESLTPFLYQDLLGWNYSYAGTVIKNRYKYKVITNTFVIKLVRLGHKENVKSPSFL